MKKYIKLKLVFLLLIGLVFAALVACRSGCKVTDIEMSNVMVQLNDDTIPFPEAPEYQELLAEVLSGIKEDRGSFLPSAFTTYAPGEVCIYSDNLDINFWGDSIIVSTLQSGGKLQSKRKMTEVDQRLKDKLLNK